MKDKFWLITTLILFLLSSIFLFGLRKIRLENTSLQKDLQTYINEYSSVIKESELKILSPMNSYNKYVDSKGFQEDWNDSTVYLRIHDSICMPCSSFMFDYIVNKYLNSKRYNLHILGSYKMNHNFVGDLKKLGLERVKCTNSVDQLGFIGADSLAVPYLFTISDSKISSMLILSAAKNIEIDTYFNMIDRILLH
jgi:hypothetical protein